MHRTQAQRAFDMRSIFLMCSSLKGLASHLGQPHRFSSIKPLKFENFKLAPFCGGPSLHAPIWLHCGPPSLLRRSVKPQQIQLTAFRPPQNSTSSNFSHNSRGQILCTADCVIDSCQMHAVEIGCPAKSSHGDESCRVIRNENSSTLPSTQKRSIRSNGSHGMSQHVSSPISRKQSSWQWFEDCV